jgi:hypothetical protein
MMKFYLYTTLLVLSQFILIQCESDKSWKQFVKKHKKNFKSKLEEEERQKIFNENLAVIDDLNAQNLGYTIGVNRFADMPIEEALKRFTGLRSREKESDAPTRKLPNSNDNSEILSRLLNRVSTPSSYGKHIFRVSDSLN